MLSFLDKSALRAVARVEKAISHDVAQVLFETVPYAHMRQNMSRGTVSTGVGDPASLHPGKHRQGCLARPSG
jgi:hypothetical protein